MNSRLALLVVLGCAASALGAQSAIRKAYSSCARIYIHPSGIDFDSSGTAFQAAEWGADRLGLTFRNRYSNEVNVASESDVRTFIEMDRMRQLLGGGSSSALEAVGKAMSAEYVVLFGVNRTRNSTSITASLVKVNNNKFLVRRMASVSPGTDPRKAAERVADELVDELQWVLELCPFQGAVKVQLVETRKSDRTSTGSTFCNKQWRDLKRTHRVNISDDQQWQIDRWGRAGQAEGSLRWRGVEDVHDVEEHGCYPCKSGTMASRSSDRRVTTTTEVDSLSRSSAAVDPDLHDAMVRLEFKRDSTYTVFIRAASDKGLARRKVSHSITGACDTDGGEQDERSGARSTPLELRLGPFRGTPMDRVLSGKGRLDHQQTAEWTKYIDYSFSLKRLFK